MGHRHPPPPTHPYMYISLRECNWKGWALKLVYIKSPMYVALWLMILMGPNPLLSHWKGWALKTRLFLPKWHSLCSLLFQGPKKTQLQCPPLSMALAMDIVRIKINHYVPSYKNNRYINRTGLGFDWVKNSWRISHAWLRRIRNCLGWTNKAVRSVQLYTSWWRLSLITDIWYCLREVLA